MIKQLFNCQKSEQIDLDENFSIELQAMSQDKSTKSRYWAFILWEDSYNHNYINIMSQAGLTAVISPWHDKDLNEGTGEIKKKHKHVLLLFEGPTTYKKVKEYADLVNGSVCIVQNSPKNAIAYWTHKNNPEKASYDPKDIELVGASSLQEIIELTSEDIKNIWKSIKEMVHLHKMRNYYELVDYYLEDGYINEFDYVINHTLAVDKYISSFRYKENTDKEKKSIYLGKKVVKKENI